MTTGVIWNTNTPGNEALQRVNPAIGIGKSVLMDIWGVGGFQMLDLIPSQC
jgi:hypothetical protein